MPARGAPKPPPAPPEKDDWLHAFHAELIKLRPHLDGYGGSGNKLLRTIAIQAWGARQAGPKPAARAWHEANTAAPKSTVRKKACSKQPVWSER